MGLLSHDSQKSKLAYLIQMFHKTDKTLCGGNPNFQPNNCVCSGNSSFQMLWVKTFIIYKYNF